MSTLTANGAACTCPPPPLDVMSRCRSCRLKDAEARDRRDAEVRPAPAAKPKRRRAKKEKPPAAPPPAPELLTVQDVAALVNFGVRTIWRMVEQGRFPQPIRWTRKLVRWHAATIKAYLDGLLDAPATDAKGA